MGSPFFVADLLLKLLAQATSFLAQLGATPCSILRSACAQSAQLGSLERIRAAAHAASATSWGDQDCADAPLRSAAAAVAQLVLYVPRLGGVSHFQPLVLHDDLCLGAKPDG